VNSARSAPYAALVQIPVFLVIQLRYAATSVYTPGYLGCAQPYPQDTTPTWRPDTTRGPPESPCNQRFCLHIPIYRYPAYCRDILSSFCSSNSVVEYPVSWNWDHVTFKISNILNLGTTVRCMLSCMFRPLYPRYPFGRRLGGPQI
jgi:hypothetical protein